MSDMVEISFGTLDLISSSQADWDRGPLVVYRDKVKSRWTKLI
jgi:hypothetical protein